MGQEAIFSCIVLVIQRIKNDEVGLWRTMLEERSIVLNIDTEEGNIEVVAVVVKESHEKSRWRKSRTHLEVPFVHVSYKEKNCRV